MRVWTCTDHAGFYPVGTASVVVAPDKERAAYLLSGALAAKGLDPSDFTLDEVNTSEEAAHILRDGDY